MSLNWHDKKFQVPDVKFKERLMHQSWCIKNDITIYLVQEEYEKCFIRINDKGKIEDYKNDDEEIVYYKQTKLKAKNLSWSKQVWLLYTEYYLKYNTNDKI